jgi:hypothetical protein
MVITQVPENVPCVFPCCDGLFHRQIYPEAADGGFFPACWTCWLFTKLGACTLQEGDFVMRWMGLNGNRHAY